MLAKIFKAFSSYLERMGLIGLMDCFRFSTFSLLLEDLGNGLSWKSSQMSSINF
jgi:hypothetical protein